MGDGYAIKIGWMRVGLVIQVTKLMVGNNSEGISSECEPSLLYSVPLFKLRNTGIWSSKIASVWKGYFII